MTDSPALPELVDSHCHLDFPDFDGEAAALLGGVEDVGHGLEALDDSAGAGAVGDVAADQDAAAFVGVGLRTLVFDLLHLRAG